MCVCVCVCLCVYVFLYIYIYIYIYIFVCVCNLVYGMCSITKLLGGVVPTYVSEYYSLRLHRLWLCTHSKTTTYYFPPYL